MDLCIEEIRESISLTFILFRLAISLDKMEDPGFFEATEIISKRVNALLVVIVFKMIAFNITHHRFSIENRK